jgi:hypothetical protein
MCAFSEHPGFIFLTKYKKLSREFENIYLFQNFTVDTITFKYAKYAVDLTHNLKVC